MKQAGMSWAKYCRIGLGRRLSRLGEKLGIDWLIYNPIHFHHFHEHAVANAPGVVACMRELFPDARRYLDVGAGSGAFAAEVRRTRVEVVACEHNRAGRQMGERQGVDMRDFDLTQEPPASLAASFDLAYCFEVAEHLPEVLGRVLVRFLADQAPIVVFTAAHPGQGGTGHINEQPKSYWIERFREVGMTLDAERTDLLLAGFKDRRVPGSWFHNNALVFVRVPAAPDVEKGQHV